MRAKIQLFVFLGCVVIPGSLAFAGPQTASLGRKDVASLERTRKGLSFFGLHRKSHGPLKNSEYDDFVEEETPESKSRRTVLTNVFAGGLLVSSVFAGGQLYLSEAYTPNGFVRTRPIQFLAALGDPKANSGGAGTAKKWGIWREDPGPRGVWLKDYDKTLVAKDGLAPAGWRFDPKDWWLEEHGLIMEQPRFPVPAGRYLVTGGRQVVTGLTINNDGSWKLDDPTATLYDVTHLPCRSARYTPLRETSGSAPLAGGPQTARISDFPVAPGGIMPEVPGCQKQDYAVIFVVGKAV